MYSGSCEGGPYHGKPIHHPEPRIKVAMSGPKVVTWFAAPTKEIKVHAYEFVDGRWLWRGP